MLDIDKQSRSQVKMTDVLVFKPESSEEPSAQKNFTDLQRTDGEESSSLQCFPERENSSPEGWTSKQEPERRENCMYMEDKKSDDDDDYDEREDDLKERGDSSLADDEDEDDDELQETWMSEKARQAFTPNVMIVKPLGNQEDLNESSMREEIQMEKVPLHPQFYIQSEHFHPQWMDEIEKPRESCCGELVRLCVFGASAAVIFPFLAWGGYELLPFNTPEVNSTPVRLIYTLRSAFFATIPIVLGLLVQGVSRLKFGTLTPLFERMWKNREVAVHGHFVRDSLHLFLLYFLQLAVMATYSQQEVLKLVPVLTIIFVLGRLIYWVCAVFGSSVRALGFGLSFFPLLVLLGTNFYFICSAEGQEVVFDVAPPTTAPPPKQRWWG